MNEQKKQILWTKNFILLVLVNLIMFVSFQLYPPSLPPYLKSLGVPESLLGWYTASTTAAAVAVRPFIGILLDSWGRKYIFLTGLAFVLLTVALMAFFPYAVPLLFLRFFQGLGWGVITTSAATVATDNIPKKRMGEGIGYFSLSIGLSLAVGPALALSMSMEALLYFSIALMAAASVLALFLKYEPAEKSEGAKPKFAVEKTALVPTALICITNICFGAMVTFMVIYSKSKGIENISSYYVIYAVVLMVSRPLIGKLVDRNWHVCVMAVGIVCMILSLLSLAFAAGLTMFNIGAAFYGIGQGAVLTTSQTLSVINAPKNKIGTANATYAMGFDVGLSVGAVLSGVMVAHIGYSAMFLLLTAAPLLSGTVFWYAHKRNVFLLQK